MTRQQARDGIEVLGEVTAPSGTVLVVDTGMLGLWSHDRPPLMPAHAMPEDVVAAANASIDFRIEGPDAERAGKALNRSWHPLFLYDIPPRWVERTKAAFAECVREHGLDARLVALDRRVSHRERVAESLAYGGGAGQVSFHGIWAVAVAEVPAERPLRVLGERMDLDGLDEGRWRQVWLECEPGGVMGLSQAVGSVMVDKARLMFADADALGQWQHEEPLDGRADVVFWGRDAARVADEVGAADLGDGKWGWVDLPVREAVQKGLPVEEMKQQGRSKFALDFRPHSHHYRVMQQVRATETESGTVEVGGARVCTFMTTWGDGVFPVYRDLGAGGRLVRVRIDLGNEDIVRRQREMEERYPAE